MKGHFFLTSWVIVPDKFDLCYIPVSLITPVLGIILLLFLWLVFVVSTVHHCIHSYIIVQCFLWLMTFLPINLCSPMKMTFPCPCLPWIITSCVVSSLEESGMAAAHSCHVGILIIEYILCIKTTLRKMKQFLKAGHLY